ncbi:type II secretion system protein [Aromatoleum toluvorans]|uniref:type II secretion system protein n=1 Tax=Aromatoleum toluvorans TaxID=92002 RepID=UPI001B7D231C|nr:type II secretion system protein [Aromatoleum toluvorans]
MPPDVHVRERGFTYIGVLVLVVMMTLALVGTAQLWSTASLRARERELLWVGSQYAHALRLYYETSPDLKRFPQRLDDLLTDQRSPKPRHHLRRLYADPITRSTDWGLIRGADGGIVGVYSQSRDTPLKRARFPAEWMEFEGVETYADWQFVADRAFSTTAQTTANANAAPGFAAGTPAPVDPRRSLSGAARAPQPAPAVSPFRYTR